MENKKAIVIALVCFTISIVLVKAYLTVKERELTSDFGDLVDVVVANGDYFRRNKTNFIPEYTILTPDMLAVTKVFKNYRQPMTVLDPSEIVGKATYVSLFEGEQVTLTKLVHQDGRPVLDRQVEKRMRAVTLMITPESGVSRLIRPGNRVDVLITPMYEDTTGNPTVEVKTLVQNVPVLATGKHIMNEIPTRVDRELMNSIEEANAKLKRKDILQASAENLHTSRPDDTYNYVTLQFSMEDAQKITFLTHEYGDRVITLALRNTNDTTPVDKVGTTILDDVLGPDSDFWRATKQKPPPPTPSPKPRYYDYVGDQKIPKW